MEQKTMERLHQVLLEMLDAIDRICRNNEISYFLDSGTALGAVRHGGFIPWDDDVDIGMMRADYERFLRIAGEQLPDNLILQNESNEPFYYLFYSKMRKTDSYYPQGPDEEKLIHRGIQIDIFPFDYVPDDRRKADRILRRARYFRRLAELRMRGAVPENILKDALYRLLRLLPAAFYRKTYNNMLRRHCSEKTRTVASFTYRMARRKNYMFDAAALTPVKEIQFENRAYLIMNDPDQYLKIMYGDYWKLPPEIERTTHIQGNIVFPAPARI